MPESAGTLLPPDEADAPVVTTDLPAPREIRGPSAIGGGWRRFWALTWMVASTDFKLTYFGSALGYLWSLFRPLMMFGIYFLVFTKIAPVGNDIKYYGAMLLMNIMLYQFFAEATGASIAAVVNREGMVRKMQFPRLVIPLATVTTAALNLSVNLIAVLVLILLQGVPVTWTWLLLPVGLLPLVVFTIAVSTVLSALYVRFRDVQPIWQVISLALFYGSPLLYAVEKVPADLRGFIQVNPLTPILAQLRHWVIDPSAPSGWAAVGGYPRGLIPVAILVILPIFALWFFDREAPKVAERL